VLRALIRLVPRLLGPNRFDVDDDPFLDDTGIFD